MPSNIVDYGTAQEPNFEEISKAAGNLLRPYNRLLGLDFVVNGFLQLEQIAEKPYTARAILEVLKFSNAEKVGDLYILLFAPGDGTGKKGDYTLEQFTEMLSGYQFSTKPERVLPRNKLVEGVLCEAFLPICSVEGRMLYPYTVSLEQITVENIIHPTALVPGLKMGVSAERFRPNPRQALLPSPKIQIQLTCGYRRNGQRFGDPHAIFYNPKLAEGHPNRMQVAGFLSVEDKDNPLCKVLDEVGIFPE